MEQEDVTTAAGALLLGVALSWCLFGCLWVQFFIYYTTPIIATTQSKDPAWLLCIVGVLCMLESGYTLAMTHSAWVYIVDGWHTVMVLQDQPGPWTAATFPAFNGLVSSIVQVVLARRVWNLSGMSSKGSIVALSIIVLAVIEEILCLFATAKVFKFLV
ncbi:hypothetical protein AX16_003896 [Volvariella volvacea WC 439]|nr:hypothetical protein AX16_003896 [Volvariella volvacea WC 439]